MFNIITDNTAYSFLFFYSFFFNDTATTEIYTLSLHDALPICAIRVAVKPQHENVYAATLLCAPRLRRPDFQLTVFERHRFTNGTTRLDRRPCWKKNQMIRQTTEKHYRQVYEEDCDPLLRTT